MEGKFITTKEAAALLGVSFKTMQRLVYEGKIAFHQNKRGRRGAKMLFRAEDVQKYLEDRRKPSLYELIEDINRKLREGGK